MDVSPSNGNQNMGRSVLWKGPLLLCAMAQPLSLGVKAFVMFLEATPLLAWHPVANQTP